MRVLVITSVFPNPRDPKCGDRNREQLRALARRGDEVTVINVAQVTGAPYTRLLPQAARHAMLPKSAVADGMTIHYVQQLPMPEVVLGAAAPLLLGALLPYRDLA